MHILTSGAIWWEATNVHIKKTLVGTTKKKKKSPGPEVIMPLSIHSKFILLLIPFPEIGFTVW